MKKHTLSASKRDILGRKVKKLRAGGQIPGTVYGKGVKSRSVAVDYDSFLRTYKTAGETGLVELSVDGELLPVLIHTVQKDPVNGGLLHVEFHQVNLKEKVHANVPLELVGQSPAVAEKRGVLLTILDEIEVEALPTDLVEKIEVDISLLAQVDQEVKIKDLSVPAGFTVLSDGELTVVKIGSLITKEAASEAAAEAAKAAEAAAATPSTEGTGAQENAPQTAPAAETPQEEKK